LKLDRHEIPQSQLAKMHSQIEFQTNGSPVQGLDVKATASSPKTQRISALDFTKGALVLIMVLYHWINYFIGPQWEYYRYLRFLTPSFIFITGFMVSHVYLSKYDAADPRLPKRLLTRGIKLLAIFIALNVARTVIVPALGTGVVLGHLFDLRNIFTVFVSGNLPVVGGKLVSFSILVPISYVLILSGLLMYPYRFYRYTFHAVCVLLLLFILILGLIDVQSPNLELFTIGMLGVLVGFAPIMAINHFVQHPYVLAAAYLCYAIAITAWNVPFPLLIVGVCLSLMVIYLVGISASESGVIGSEVILLGKYSLFGYISQMVIIQFLNAGFHHVDPGIAALGISFVAAFTLTLVSVELVNRARAKAVSLDKLYKAVFA
jgi:peptidoglycan/LPS O-acetylase OafA/YrhL